MKINEKIYLGQWNIGQLVLFLVKVFDIKKINIYKVFVCIYLQIKKKIL